MPATETIELRPSCALAPRCARWLFAALARRHHRHAVTVASDSVAIDSQLPGRREHVVFSRHRAHVRLRPAVSPRHPSRLIIESHGRACEVRLINESPPMIEAATQPRSA
jgi:hypothetical protein